MSTARTVALHAVYCPVHDWIRTDPTAEQAATDLAGAHDDALHRGVPTTVLVTVHTHPRWLEATTVAPARADALLRRTVITAVTAGGTT